MVFAVMYREWPEHRLLQFCAFEPVFSDVDPRAHTLVGAADPRSVSKVLFVPLL